MSITPWKCDLSESIEFESQLETFGGFIWSARVNTTITLRAMLDCLLLEARNLSQYLKLASKFLSVFTAPFSLFLLSMGLQTNMNMDGS